MVTYARRDYDSLLAITSEQCSMLHPIPVGMVNKLMLIVR